jgi:hypothetical protein
MGEEFAWALICGGGNMLNARSTIRAAKGVVAR